MPTDRKERCEHCTFREPIHETCHRFPPQVVYTHGHGVGCYWPEVRLGHWCGEFKPIYPSAL
jgi:hypothetical protein